MEEKQFYICWLVQIITRLYQLAIPRESSKQAFLWEMTRTESLKRAPEAVFVSHEGREGAEMKRKDTQQPAGGRSSAKGKADVSKAVLVAISAAGAIAASAGEEGTSAQSPLAP